MQPESREPQLRSEEPAKRSENVKQEEPNNDPIAEASNVVGSEASGEYVAPFHPSNSGTPREKDRYAVTFNKGHTLEKHLEVIGFRTGSSGPGSWYSSTLSIERRERVRRDPGVKSVEQYGDIEWA